MIVLKGRYYKKATPIMLSGLPLPTDEDGVVRDKSFDRCHFHPSCGEVKFENCEFSYCDGLHYLELRVNCVTKGLTTFGG